MRCFKDIATTGTGSFDAEDLQLIFPHFAQEGFIGAKSGLDLRGHSKIIQILYVFELHSGKLT